MWFEYYTCILDIFFYVTYTSMYLVFTSVKLGFESSLLFVIIAYMIIANLLIFFLLYEYYSSSLYISMFGVLSISQRPTQVTRVCFTNIQLDYLYPMRDTLR